MNPFNDSDNNPPEEDRDKIARLEAQLRSEREARAKERKEAAESLLKEREAREKERKAAEERLRKERDARGKERKERDQADKKKADMKKSTSF